MIPVRNIMANVIVHVEFGTSVRQAAERMREKQIGGILIKQGGAFVGIMTEKDVILKVVAAGRDPETTKVDEVMGHPLISIEADHSVLEASNTMDRHRIRHLAVTEKGEVVGVVSVRDLLHHIYGWGR